MPKHLNREYIFIRHGQSESNVNENMAAGMNYDAPLTELEKQAEALGERFKRKEFILITYLPQNLGNNTASIFLSALGNKDIPTKRSDKLNELQIPGWRAKQEMMLLLLKSRQCGAKWKTLHSS